MFLSKILVWKLVNPKDSNEYDPTIKCGFLFFDIFIYKIKLIKKNNYEKSYKINRIGFGKIG